MMGEDKTPSKSQSTHTTLKWMLAILITPLLFQTLVLVSQQPFPGIKEGTLVKFVL